MWFATCLVMVLGVLYDLVLVRSGTHCILTVRLQLHLGPRLVGGEADLVEVTEEYRLPAWPRLCWQVVGGSDCAGAGVCEIVVLVLLALVVVEVVPVDLLRERHSGEVTEQLIDRSGNKNVKCFINSCSVVASNFKISFCETFHVR